MSTTLYGYKCSSIRLYYIIILTQHLFTDIILSVITIRASCQECGSFSLASKDLTVVNNVSCDTYFYRFMCPDEGKMVIKETSRRIANFLVRTGVLLELIDFATEHEQEGLPVAEITHPITVDELIDFSVAIQNLSTDDFMNATNVE